MLVDGVAERKEITIPASAGRVAPVVLVDLLWLTAAVWSIAALAQVPDAGGTRLVLMACGCHAVALGLTATVAATAPASRPARLLVPLLGIVAVVVGTWWSLYPGWPLLGTGWLVEVAQSFARAPYRWPSELVALPAALAFYWRGYWVARHAPAPEVVLRSFQTGLIILALLSATIPGPAQGGWALYVLLYLGLGLATLALVRTRRGGQTGRAGARLGGVAAAAMVVAGTVALAAFALWFAPILLELLTKLLELIWAAFTGLMAWLSDLFGPPPAPELSPSEVGRTPSPARETLINFFRLSDEARQIGAYAVWAAFLYPIVFAIVRYLSEVWRHLRDASYLAEVQAGSLGERGSLWRWLLGAFRWLDRWLWRRLGGRPLEGNPAAWPVRLVYRDLLKAAAKRGAARAPTMTASEYVAVASAVFPDHEDDLVALTRVYERARYGPRPEKEDLGALRERCKRMTRRRWWRRGGSGGR